MLFKIKKCGLFARKEIFARALAANKLLASGSAGFYIAPFSKLITARALFLFQELQKSIHHLENLQRAGGR